MRDKLCQKLDRIDRTIRLETAFDRFIALAQKMEQMMEQTTERLLAEMKSGRGETMSEIKVQIGALASRMDVSEETLDKMDAAVKLSREKREENPKET
jgi:hypothetical protein